MGWIRSAKADKVGEQAKVAYVNGQPVFATMFNSPAFNLGFSGEIPDWSGMIAAVEAQGWGLANWAASTDAKGNPQAYAVFRRRA